MQDDAFDLPISHSRDDYRTALKAVRPILKRPKYLDMLKAHYAAPGHTVTASELARAVGYQNYNAANLHYGKLAGEVAKALGYTPGEIRGRDVNVTVDLAVLVRFSGGVDEEEVRWTMLPGVVEALEAMRWVRPQPSSG